MRSRVRQRLPLNNSNASPLSDDETTVSTNNCTGNDTLSEDSSPGAEKKWRKSSLRRRFVRGIDSAAKKISASAGPVVSNTFFLVALTFFLIISFRENIFAFLPYWNFRGPRRYRIGLKNIDLILKLNGEKLKLTLPKEFSSDDSTSEDSLDFGPLGRMRLLAGEDFRRPMYTDPNMGLGKVVGFDSDPDDNVDYNEAFDDDYLANHNWGWRTADHKMHRVETRKCRYPEWARRTTINCNNFHELDRIDLLAERNMRFVGNGAYRQVFSVTNEVDRFAFKSLVYNSVGGETKTYLTEDFEVMRMDAMIAEMFTSNPLFVDIYGFCGVSAFFEFMPNGDMDELSFPLYDRGDGKHYNETQLLHMNNLDPDLKLRAALEMAESVAYLHNYEGGVIVHDDIQLTQFLLTDAGKKDWQTADIVVKINDFNRGVFMQYDEKHEEYCRYRNGPGAGDWRAPEEYLDNPLNEKIDVFSVGMNIFGMLTGLCPHHQLSRTKYVRSEIKKGNMPHVDPRIIKRSYAEAKLAEVAMKCFTFDPDERPDIFEVVTMLREAYDHNLALKKKKKSRDE